MNNLSRVIKFETNTNIRIIEKLEKINVEIKKQFAKKNRFLNLDKMIVLIKEKNNQIKHLIENKQLKIKQFDFNIHFLSLESFINQILIYGSTGWKREDLEDLILSLNKSYNEYWLKLCLE